MNFWGQAGLTDEIIFPGKILCISSFTPMGIKKKGWPGKWQLQLKIPFPSYSLDQTTDARCKTEPQQYNMHIRSPSWFNSSYGLFQFSFLQPTQTYYRCTGCKGTQPMTLGHSSFPVSLFFPWQLTVPACILAWSTRYLTKLSCMTAPGSHKAG